MNFLLQANIPIPKDIPLPLPVPEPILVFVLVFSFLVHIVFVNLMLGGSLLTFWCQIKGLKNKEYDELAHEIAKTITVNKSLAVVMGVAPLLSINTLYTMYFYTANSLTGLMWIAIIPLVTVAFLLTYLHKYTWRIFENNKAVHISIIALACLIFLFIPLIFLTNINLMLFPEKWGLIKGFISALTLPNVFPRYLHFIFASLSVTGLFLFWYIGRKKYPFETIFKNLNRYDIKKKAYSLVLTASVIQFLIGPIVLVTLPSKGVGWNLIFIIFIGASIAIPAMYWIYRAIVGKPEHINNNFWKIAICLTITVIFMGSGRHIYRSNSLAPHQKMMAQKTKDFIKASEEARKNPVEDELEIDESLGDVAVGGALFAQNCSACHAKDVKVVGPPIIEMATIYKDNAEDLKKWIKNPGKRRADAPQMPSFEGKLSDDELAELSKYILTIK
ncbi:c-type cytochrome [Pedobacter rhizosphaerae]|uniref:Cytochrome c n=1 Tax=Pedobacter rhizosphaerae TaxID=390241 RepID=A0A1H9STW0_9SPHI|nr:cytochrome c [Pedobacter rhizosphaerae]SER88351.1 cytochrome c [Pedobacter rhizosphaerae]